LKGLRQYSDAISAARCQKGNERVAKFARIAGERELTRCLIYD
jgi:hypothetical protein